MTTAKSVYLKSKIVKWLFDCKIHICTLRRKKGGAPLRYRYVIICAFDTHRLNVKSFSLSLMAQPITLVAVTPSPVQEAGKIECPDDLNNFASTALAPTGELACETCPIQFLSLRGNVSERAHLERRK